MMKVTKCSLMLGKSLLSLMVMVPRTVEAELSSRNTSDGSEGSIFWIDSYWNGTNLPPSQEFSTFIPHRELKKEESYWKDRNIEKVEEILIKYLYQKVLRIVTRNNVMTHQFILEVRNVPFQSAASNSYEPLANNRIFYAYFHVNISVPQCLEIYLKKKYSSAPVLVYKVRKSSLK